MKIHLVDETVPLGTTFCQKVPEGIENEEQLRNKKKET